MFCECPDPDVVGPCSDEEPDPFSSPFFLSSFSEPFLFVFLLEERCPLHVSGMVPVAKYSVLDGQLLVASSPVIVQTFLFSTDAGISKSL